MNVGDYVISYIHDLTMVSKNTYEWIESLQKFKLCNIGMKKISRNESTHLDFAYSPANGNREKIVTWYDVIWPSITWAFAHGCYSYRSGIRKFSSSHRTRSFGAKEYYYIQDEAVWGNETTRQVCDQTVMFLEIPLFVYWFVLYTFSNLLMEAFVSQSRWMRCFPFLIQECPIGQN